ncbi:MAG: hypothetical protein WC325_06600 [Candidatus Bathyarchaeia archaeon]|jgi:hypothetical protein
MRYLNKNLYGLLAVPIVLMLLLTQLTTAIPTVTVYDDVLVFLNDVVDLDVAKYDVALLWTVLTHPPELGGLVQESGKYSLTSADSKIDVLFKFRNGTLSWCLMRVLEGSPHYNKPLPENVFANVKSLLQRYQINTKDSDLTKMRAMLDIVDAEKNTTTIIDNIKLEILSNSRSSSFEWRYNYNGADYSGFVVDFKDEEFYAFSDDRSYYKISGTDVNIGNDEAINIALDYAENFSWFYDGEEIKNFKIVERMITAELLTKSRMPLELYPYWKIILPLDGLYPGPVGGIMILVWADTAEVIDCQPLVYGGIIGDESAQSPYTSGSESVSDLPDSSQTFTNSTDSSSQKLNLPQLEPEDKSNPLPTELIVAGVVVAVLVFLCTVFFLRYGKIGGLSSKPRHLI